MNNNTCSDCNFYFYTSLIPPIVNVRWENDYAYFYWCETNNDNVIYEIWESKNGSPFIHSVDISSGNNNYKYFCDQNANMIFKIRVRRNDVYSEFSAPLNLKTPLVFKTDQSVLTPVVFTYLSVVAGKTINVDWGDGTNINVNTVGYFPGPTKNYAITKNPYYITITGDVDFIALIEFTGQPKAYGDLSKWNLPVSLGLFHFYANPGFTGDISKWTMPVNMGIFHVSSDNFSGDLTAWQFAPNQNEMRLDNNHFTGDLTGWTFPMLSVAPYLYVSLSNNHFTGNISGWIFPGNMVNLDTSHNYFTGNLSAWIIPGTLSDIILVDGITPPDDLTNNYTGNITGWTFPIVESPTMENHIECGNSNFTGDLSGKIIFAGTKVITVNFKNSHLTKLPRGNFKWVSIYNFKSNNCNQAEVDAILAYIDAYFVGAVVPLCNCAYTFNGAGMAAPSAAGLVSKASIIAKYVAAGFVATILNN
jgi:hypothetical protein